MSIKINDFYLDINWKTIVYGVGTIGGLIFLNKLSNNGQLSCIDIDLNNKRLKLNS